MGKQDNYTSLHDVKYEMQLLEKLSLTNQNIIIKHNCLFTVFLYLSKANIMEWLLLVSVCYILFPFIVEAGW